MSDDEADPFDAPLPPRKLNGHAKAASTPSNDGLWFRCQTEQDWVRWRPTAALAGMRTLSPGADGTYRRFLDLQACEPGGVVAIDDRTLAILKCNRRTWYRHRDELLIGDKICQGVAQNGTPIFWSVVMVNTMVEAMQRIERASSGGHAKATKAMERKKTGKTQAPASNVHGSDPSTSPTTLSKNPPKVPAATAEKKEGNGFDHLPTDPHGPSTDQLLETCRLVLADIGHTLNMDVSFYARPDILLLEPLRAGFTRDQFSQAAAFYADNHPDQINRGNVNSSLKTIVSRLWWCRKNNEPVYLDPEAQRKRDAAVSILVRCGAKNEKGAWKPFDEAYIGWSIPARGPFPGTPGSAITLDDLNSTLKTVGYRWDAGKRAVVEL